MNQIYQDFIIILLFLVKYSIRMDIIRYNLLPNSTALKLLPKIRILE